MSSPSAEADVPHATSRVVSSIVSLLAGEAVSRGIAFFGTVYLARVLSPTGFGIVGFATAICGYVAMAVTAGFNELGAREVARRPKDAAHIAASVIVVRLGLAVVAFAGLALVAFMLPKPPVVRTVVALSGLMLFSISADTGWAYKGIERTRRVGLAQVVGQALYVGLVFLLVHEAADVTRVPVAQFLGESSAALFLAVPLLRSGPRGVDLREGMALLRLSGPTTLLRLLRTVILSFSVVLLGYLVGEHDVGLYTAGSRICFLMLAIAIAVHVAYLPAMARAAAAGAPALDSAANRSFELAAAIALPATFGGAVLARPLLTALFGPSYADGAAAFAVLLLSVGLFFLTQATHNVLLAADRIQVETRIVAIAAAVNVALGLALIPRYGLIAAAGVTALSEGLMLAGGVWAIRASGVRLRSRLLLRPLAAAGAMSLALPALTRVGGMPLAVGGGGVIYALALFALSGIPQEIRDAIAARRSAAV